MGNRFVVSAIAVVLLVGLAHPVHAEEAAARREDSSVWKRVFFTSLGVTVALAGVSVYAHAQMTNEASQSVATKPGGFFITQDDCNDRATITNDAGGHFDNACAWRSRNRTASLFAMGFGVVTIATAYLAFVDRGASSSASNTSGIAVTPTISRDGAGASLQLRW